MMIVTMIVTAEESVQRLKNRRRKRKSYSSADKILQSYTDRKDKAEEEKIKLLREMQQKKMRFSVNFWMSRKKRKPYLNETLLKYSS